MININTASKIELMELKGVGDKIALKIMEYRKDHKFIKKEDIKQVSGIGEIMYNNIKDRLIVE